MDTTELTQIARQRADVRIDAALAAVRKAMQAVAGEFGIPDGIHGHTPEDLLGRISQVPSLSRELRVALAQALAKREIEAMTASQARPEPQAAAGVRQAPPQRPRPAPPVEAAPKLPEGMPLEDLDGVTVQTVRILRQAGLRTVGDVARVPDEHLEKIGGIGPRSIHQLRDAIARAAAPRKG